MTDGTGQMALSVQGLAELHATRPGPTDADAVCRALGQPDWLGLPVDPPPDRPGLRRVASDLSFVLPADRRTLTFRKAALIDVGIPARSAKSCTVEIGWRAASFAPLFPVFAGRLHVSAEGLTLDGLYAPPAGEIGVLIDRVFLRFVARRTAEWFLERLTQQLTDE